MKMYKVRLRKWGLRKNISSEEALQIQRQMDHGHVTLPVAHGRQLGSKRLRSMLRRPQRSYQMLGVSVAREAAPNQVRPPGDMHFLESALFEVTRYSQVGIEEQWWDFSTSNHLTSATSAWGIFVAEIGSTHLQQKDNAHAFRLLDKCCAEFQPLLIRQQSLLIISIFVAIVGLSLVNEPVALSVTRFVTEMCSIELGRHHPLAKLCNNIRSMGMQSARLSARVIIMSQLDTFLAGTGRGNIAIASCKMIVLQWLNGCGLISDESCLNEHRTILRELEKSRNSSEDHQRIVRASLFFAGWLISKGHYLHTDAILQCIEQEPPALEFLEKDETMLTIYAGMKTCVIEQRPMERWRGIKISLLSMSAALTRDACPSYYALQRMDGHDYGKVVEG